MQKKLIRFDWAIKKLLRHKANFDILEGFLSELLRFDVKIESILESEGNQQSERDKFNKVDILVKSDRGELMLVEIQNDSETDYFQRMLYGTSTLVTEYIQKGEPYNTIKKIYSINIVYFSLGQGKDYVYKGITEFKGLHQNDLLLPGTLQKQRFTIEGVYEIYPIYYVLKINDFDDVARDTLDEWIYFLKNSEIKDTFKAKGLDKAKERLVYEKLSETDKKVYDRFQESLMIEKSVTETARLEGIEEGIEKGELKRTMEIAITLLKKGFDNKFVSEATGLTVDEVENIRKRANNL